MKRVLSFLVLSLVILSIHAQEKVLNDSILSTYSYRNIDSKSDIGKADSIFQSLPTFK